MYINDDHVMTLAQFMAMPTWVAHAFEWGKLLKCHLKGQTNRKLAHGQNFDYSGKKKENVPRASSAPALALNTIIFKQVIGICSRSQVSVYRTIGHLIQKRGSINQMRRYFFFTKARKKYHKRV